MSNDKAYSAYGHESHHRLKYGPGLPENAKTSWKVLFQGFFSILDRLARSGRFLEIGPGPGYQTGLVMEKYNPEAIVGLEYSSDMDDSWTPVPARPQRAQL